MATAQRAPALDDQVVPPVTKDLAPLKTLMRSEPSHVRQKRSFQMKNLLTDVERVGDTAEDTARYARESVNVGVPLSAAIQEPEQVSRSRPRPPTPTL
jgi:hypothetical protein